MANNENNNDYFAKFTYAQATALAALLRAAKVPSKRWKELAYLFADNFQKALKEAFKTNGGNGHKGES